MRTQLDWSRSSSVARLAPADEWTEEDALFDDFIPEQDVNKYKEVVKSLPEVRRQRIEELKRQIERGEYRIDSRKIADKILERQPEDDLF